MAGSSVGRCGCLSSGGRWTRNSLVATEADIRTWRGGVKTDIEFMNMLIAVSIGQTNNGYIKRWPTNTGEK